MVSMMLHGTMWLPRQLRVPVTCHGTVPHAAASQLRVPVTCHGTVPHVAASQLRVPVTYHGIVPHAAATSADGATDVPWHSATCGCHVS